MPVLQNRILKRKIFMCISVKSLFCNVRTSNFLNIVLLRIQWTVLVLLSSSKYRKLRNTCNFPGDWFWQLQFHFHHIPTTTKHNELSPLPFPVLFSGNNTGIVFLTYDTRLKIFDVELDHWRLKFSKVHFQQMAFISPSLSNNPKIPPIIGFLLQWQCQAPGNRLHLQQGG